MESGESAAAGLSLQLVRPVARRRNSINHYRASPPPPSSVCTLPPTCEGRCFSLPPLPLPGRMCAKVESG